MDSQDAYESELLTQEHTTFQHTIFQYTASQKTFPEDPQLSIETDERASVSHVLHHGDQQTLASGRLFDELDLGALIFVIFCSIFGPFLVVWRCFELTEWNFFLNGIASEKRIRLYTKIEQILRVRKPDLRDDIQVLMPHNVSSTPTYLFMSSIIFGRMLYPSRLFQDLSSYRFQDPSEKIFFVIEHACIFFFVYFFVVFYFLLRAYNRIFQKPWCRRHIIANGFLLLHLLPLKILQKITIRMEQNHQKFNDSARSKKSN